MLPRDAAEALDAVHRLRHQTARSQERPWFPLIWFGAATMLSAGVLATHELPAIVIFWVAVGCGGAMLIRRHRIRQARGAGLSARNRVWRLSALMFGTCLAVGVAVSITVAGRAGLTATFAAIGVGYLVLGVMHRDALTPSLVVVAVAVGIAVAASPAPGWLAELVVGAGLIVTGVVLRARESHRDTRRPVPR